MVEKQTLFHIPLYGTHWKSSGTVLSGLGVSGNFHIIKVIFVSEYIHQGPLTLQQVKTQSLLMCPISFITFSIEPLMHLFWALHIVSNVLPHLSHKSSFQLPKSRYEYIPSLSGETDAPYHPHLTIIAYVNHIY